MDTIEIFIRKLEAELEELTPGTLQPETDYRQLHEWSSMHALILIALAETEYDVTLTGEDLRSSRTVQSVYSLIASRAN
ncbi:MAG: acyl carrier protein [Bacteroidia bacterium]